MKKALLCLAGISLLFKISAQPLSYELSILSDSAYIPLEDPTFVDLPENWDDEEFVIDLGMNFPIQGVLHNSFTFEPNGIGLPADLSYVFAFLAVDFVAKDETSTISYKLLGEAPNRVFVLEHVNLGFYGEEPRESIANFQAFLKENGCWGAHIGLPYTVLDPEACYSGSTGPSLGFINFLTSAGQFFEGNPLKPFQVDFDGKSLPALDGTPETLTYYELCPVSTVNTSFAESAGNFLVYPNPSNGMVTFKSTGVESNSIVEFLDLTGRIVSSAPLSNGSTLIDLSHLQAGVYTYFVKSEKEINSGKISITK